ncbi:MAG: hypothetical protein GY714_04290 [Desulfobacterales bacterium]|nr:hypothetical protein [Desulfobacterales bacterium]
MEEFQINIIRDAALNIEDSHLEVALKLMKICQSFRPKGPLIKQKVLQYSDLIKKNKNLHKPNKKKIESLEKNIELLRDKTFQIHEAMNYLDLLEIKEIDDPAAKLSPVEIVNKKSTKTLIVFGGMALQPSMPPKEFFRSFSDKELNLVFVKDFKQCWYQKGLLGKSNDIKSTIKYLKSIIPNTTQKLITLGTSSGGYAAIRLGVELNANKIIAFSPQTKIANSVFKRFKSIDSRIIDIDFENVDLDLELYLSKHKNLNIDVYYGNENIEDKLAVDHINQHVNAYPFPTKSHSIANYLKKNNKLDIILSKI